MVGGGAKLESHILDIIKNVIITKHLKVCLLSKDLVVILTWLDGNWSYSIMLVVHTFAYTLSQLFTGTDPLRGRGAHPPQQTISLKILSILDDSYFRVYSWPPSNFWIGSNSPKETNHLTFSLRQWPPIVQIYTKKNP